MLYTFGHGTNDIDSVVRFLELNRIAALVDVRSVPKSRRNPQFAMDAMREWVPQRSGAAYRWVQELGGFRRPLPDSVNVGLRHPSFRGYADYMQTKAFLEAFRDLIRKAAETTTIIMCSETLWWRCHRRLISDAALLLASVSVEHLFVHGKPKPHVLTTGVHRSGDVLVYGDPNTRAT